MSFWDDVQKFGSSALDSVGEGMDTFVKTYAQKEAEEKSADPKAHNQKAPVVDANGKNAPAPAGFFPAMSNNTLLIAGGVLFAGVVAFVLIKK